MTTTTTTTTTISSTRMNNGEPVSVINWRTGQIESARTLMEPSSWRLPEILHPRTDLNDFNRSQREAIKGSMCWTALMMSLSREDLIRWSVAGGKINFKVLLQSKIVGFNLLRSLGLR